MDRTETRFRKRGQITGKITTSRQPHRQNEQSPQRSTSGYPLQEVVDDEVLGPSEDPVIKRFLAWDKDLRVSDKYLLAMVIAYFSRAGFPSWQYQRLHFFLALYLANDMEEDDEDSKQNIFHFLYGKNRSRIPLLRKRRFQLYRSMNPRARKNRSHIPLVRKRRFQLRRCMNPRARKNRSQIVLFQKRRFHFFCSMSCRAWVSPEELEEIQAYDPEHWVWARDRARLS
eukprot:XP_016867506.1 putative WBSCR19-like protein 6 isoform X3 [Homo sapiens]